MRLISVIMNCYNGEKYLSKALDSLLNQTYRNWELIFWDNRSTDNSVNIVSEYDDKRFRYFVADKHGSLGEGRSLAIKKISGDYVAFLDTDDIWYPNRLEESLAAFLKSDNICLVYSNTIFFSEKSKKALYKNQQISGRITKKLICNYHLSLESVTIKKKYLDKLETKFDNQFSHIADFDLLTRISTLGESYYINKVLCGWRIHENNDSFKRSYLFVQEKLQWLSKYANSKLFNKYSKEIRELKFICLAEEKLNNRNLFKINNIFLIRKHKFIYKINLIKYIFSCIPIFKSIYKLRNIY